MNDIEDISPTNPTFTDLMYARSRMNSEHRVRIKASQKETTNNHDVSKLQQDIMINICHN